VSRPEDRVDNQLRSGRGDPLSFIPITAALINEIRSYKSIHYIYPYLPAPNPTYLKEKESISLGHNDLK
jgi:hypothetical protein